MKDAFDANKFFFDILLKEFEHIVLSSVGNISRCRL